MANSVTLVEKVFISRLKAGDDSAFSCIFTAFYKDLVILCSGASGYLPTERAIRGGGYSTMITDVGPEEGQQLVNLTVEMIDETWK